MSLTITKEFLEKEYFLNNKSQEKIANIFGVSQWMIGDKMKKFGIKVLSKTRNLCPRKYDVNETFFEEINEDSAWVLGWIFSDGFIQKNCFGIKLSKRDENVLIKIKNLLRYTGKIHHNNTFLKKTRKKYGMSLLNISSKKLVNKLREFGADENKTKSIIFPEVINSLNNEEITKRFIQGFFEGDGSILLDKKRNSLCFQIVGTKSILSEIQNKLINYLGVNKTKLTNNIKGTDHYALRYRGNIQSMRIFKWLYEGANNFLNRKHNKYLCFKKIYGKDN